MGGVPDKADAHKRDARRRLGRGLAQGLEVRPAEGGDARPSALCPRPRAGQRVDGGPARARVYVSHGRHTTSNWGRGSAASHGAVV